MALCCPPVVVRRYRQSPANRLLQPQAQTSVNAPTTLPKGWPLEGAQAWQEACLPFTLSPLSQRPGKEPSSSVSWASAPLLLQGKGVLTCLMGMARPLPILSILHSAAFFSRSKSAPFRDWKRKEQAC